MNTTETLQDTYSIVNLKLDLIERLCNQLNGNGTISQNQSKAYKCIIEQETNDIKTIICGEDKTVRDIPRVFKLDINKSLYPTLSNTIQNLLSNYSIVSLIGGLVNKDGHYVRIWTKISSSETNIGSWHTTCFEPLPNNVADLVEFLGYSRIDGMPLFCAYTQENINDTFERSNNTFIRTESIHTQIKSVFGQSLSNTDFGISLISSIADHLPNFIL